MPRLPVTGGARAVWGAMLALTLAAPAAAAPAPKQPSMDTIMYHLKRDSEVGSKTRQYKAAAQAAMLYYTCPNEYGVDAGKKARYERVLREDAQALRAAFAQAHQRLTHKLPGGLVPNAITTYINKTRDETAVATGLAIQKRGCITGNFRKLDHYFEERETREQAARKKAEQKKQTSH